MTKQMVIGGAAGIPLVVLMVYGVGPAPKPLVIVFAFVPFVVLFVIATAITRRRLGLSPLWSLSVQERRLVTASLRRRERLADPRLAAAAVAHIRVAERSFRLSLFALAVIVASQAIDWAQGRHRHSGLIFGLIEVAGLLIVFGGTTTNYLRARRAKSVYATGVR